MFFLVMNQISKMLDNIKTNNNFKFLKIVALLSLTDFAFSIDSITTAVAISDQYILIIFGAIIGVLALRFTSGIFLRLLEKFLRLETAGYIAILIVGIKASFKYINCRDNSSRLLFLYFDNNCIYLGLI